MTAIGEAGCANRKVEEAGETTGEAMAVEAEAHAKSQSAVLILPAGLEIINFDTMPRAEAAVAERPATQAAEFLAAVVIAHADVLPKAPARQDKRNAPALRTSLAIQAVHGRIQEQTTTGMELTSNAATHNATMPMA